jgi:hypothetical protein
MIVASTGAPSRKGCTSARKEAALVREDGVLLITACATGDCASSCLRHVATSPRYALDRLDDPILWRALEYIGRTDRWIMMKRLEVKLRLSEDVSYVARSAVPRAQPSGRPLWLRWQTSFVPREGLTMSFTVLPKRDGVVDLADMVTAAYSDNVGHGGTIELRVPPVTVLNPHARATATPVVSVVPTVTASATPEGPAHRSRVYLPQVQGRERSPVDAP